MDWQIEPFEISTDKSRLDISVIHGYLAQSYWAEGIPEDLVRKSIDGSLCFGIYEGDRQVGFARVISDYATFAYLADVFVLESYCGKGLSKWLMTCIMAHPDLQGLRRFSLATRDAHGLYRKFGFEPVAKPENQMEIRVSDIYKKPTQK
jgi:N-acetylglutamate synthase-like GNAT family acetyltransferase